MERAGKLGKVGLGFNDWRTDVVSLRSFSLKRVSKSESECQPISFMFNAGSKSENGNMLPVKRQLLPSRKDDRVILHFDCRY